MFIFLRSRHPRSHRRGFRMAEREAWCRFFLQLARELRWLKWLFIAWL